MGTQIGTKTFLPFEIRATELDAGTSIELVSPVEGYVDEIVLTVQTAIVTGGVVTASVGTTAIGGLSATVANGAAKGTILRDSAAAGASTRHVEPYERIQVSPSAAFAGGGALTGFLVIKSSPGAPA